jgi:hypothetical protein
MQAHTSSLENTMQEAEQQYQNMCAQLNAANQMKQGMVWLLHLSWGPCVLQEYGSCYMIQLHPSIYV